MEQLENRIIDCLVSDLKSCKNLQRLILLESFYAQFELLKKIESDKIGFLYPPQGGLRFEVIELQRIDDQIHDNYNVVLRLIIEGRYIVKGSDLYFQVNFEVEYSCTYYYYTDSSCKIKSQAPLKLLKTNKIEKFLG